MESNYSTRRYLTPSRGVTIVDPVSHKIYEFGDEVPESSASARQFRGRLEFREVRSAGAPPSRDGKSSLEQGGKKKPSESLGGSSDDE